MLKKLREGHRMKLVSRRAFLVGIASIGGGLAFG